MFNHRYSGPMLRNCILWGNTAPGGPQIYNDGTSSAAITYSDVQGGCPGTGNIGADPLFTDADGADDIFGTEDDNLRLPSGSPCIDAGDNTRVPPDYADLDSDGDRSERIPWDLDTNRRITDGDADCNPVVDMGAYEFVVPQIEVPMKFTPQALNQGSQGNWVKAHFVLPERFTVGDVDTNCPAKVTEPFEADTVAEYMNVFVDEDGLVEVEAAFERAEFCSGGIDGNAVEVTAIGLLTSGQQFYGTDTVKITNNALEHLADLASYWLEESCGQPDWCAGLDLDQDGALDFVDFALFDGCCIEVVDD
jgi:hypothetical protein